MLDELPKGYRVCPVCDRSAFKGDGDACAKCEANPSSRKVSEASTAATPPVAGAPSAAPKAKTSAQAALMRPHSRIGAGHRDEPREAPELGPRYGPSVVPRPPTTRPLLAWSLEVDIPFDPAVSKNAMWQPVEGRMIQREESKEFVERFGQRLRTAMSRDLVIVQNVLWLDVFVAKPDHRSDALNVLDVLADAVQKVTGLDDRWYSLSGLDWTIDADDPRIWLKMGQELGAVDSQVCGACKQVLALSPELWHRNRSRDVGYASTCKTCTNSGSRSGSERQSA